MYTHLCMYVSNYINDDEDDDDDADMLSSSIDILQLHVIIGL